MSKPWFVFAMVLLVASAVLTACSRAPQSVPRPEEAAGSSPLVAAENPPDEPPDVVLVAAQEGEWHYVQRGAVLNGEWSTTGTMQALAPTRQTQVPWPSPVSVSSTPRIALRIGSAALPRSLTVFAYSNGLDSDGVPVGEPTLELECAQSSFLNPESTCALVPESDTWLLELPGLSGSTHAWIAVNVTWVEPRLSGNDLAVVWATWLFTLSP